MPDPKGSEDVYEIELLRSLEWIRKVGAAPRRFIEIELAEMGLSGLAKVESITACPPINPGAGRVVLMTVTHMDSGVMEIEFDGLKKALEPTINHPLFSADRNDWVPAGLLCVGEQIKTKNGAAKINAIRWKNGEHRVYNFEVEADHAYFVTEYELLSHNNGLCGRAGKQAKLKELATDTKVSSADREWIKQEMNQIERGTRTSIRNPPGKDLAHERGREAAKGFGYQNSNLQDRNLHKLQHKYDNNGRKNKIRPVEAAQSEGNQ